MIIRRLYKGIANQYPSSESCCFGPPLSARQLRRATWKTVKRRHSERHRKTMMRVAKSVATQVSRKTTAATSKIGYRAAPACPAVASGLRRALAHEGSRSFSTSDTTTGSSAEGEEKLSGSGGVDLLRGLSEEEVKHARTHSDVYSFFAADCAVLFCQL